MASNLRSISTEIQKKSGSPIPPKKKNPSKRKTATSASLTSSSSAPNLSSSSQSGSSHKSHSKTQPLPKQSNQNLSPPNFLHPQPQNQQQFSSQPNQFTDLPQQQTTPIQQSTPMQHSAAMQPPQHAGSQQQQQDHYPDYMQPIMTQQSQFHQPWGQPAMSGSFPDFHSQSQQLLQDPQQHAQTASPLVTNQLHQSSGSTSNTASTAYGNQNQGHSTPNSASSSYGNQGQGQNGQPGLMSSAFHSPTGKFFVKW